ncbi:hypothetical protein AB1Y20_016341 [Prymnesium parvum]|uniref:Uncharacterized protein n=1 Tax=Prymnesium parvum TaxID=97485 RepID=A0AB34IEY6_PRYPA
MERRQSSEIDRVHAQLQAEREKRMEYEAELEVEQAAHNSTAEMLVEVQQRLEVTLQELANLERFTKRQHLQKADSEQLERLIQEENYLQARLSFVREELKKARAESSGVDGLSI